MLSVPSVATIAGTRKSVTMTPLIIPRTSPSPSPKAIAAAAPKRMRLEDIGDDVGDQPDRRLDREVDVAGDDDERLADGRDGDDRGEDRDLDDVSTRQELRRLDRRRAPPSTTMIATRLSSRWRAITASH